MLKNQSKSFQQPFYLYCEFATHTLKTINKKYEMCNTLVAQVFTPIN